MEQQSSPSQWAGGHTGDGYDPHNSIYAPYRSGHSFAHPQAPAATLVAQPAADLSSQGVELGPCFSFGPTGAATPDIWLDPAVGASQCAIKGTIEGAGVWSTTDGSPACSSYDMAAADWGRALSLPCPNNDVQAADESLVFPRGSPIPSIADTHQPPVFQCKWQGCRSSASFRRQVDLIRHLKTIHIAPDAYPCREPNCGVAFGRKDHLKAHSKMHHKPSRKIRHRRQA
ncbi:hypothetical protein ASPVEDRAFT_762734 [Aspergillus versicolor CBS 583.65]|uniref:C2H2-type domain-containing protein n=1 Tax=Aspergillus versicolor CBS 583.65 TaxID=1036611 RepID=A0A1L9PQU1_ASPVE|nr:uncharacterized protein ASPVEDRAFT_762734 [Aspergillus versicolor CBS 583.65]OJJ03870.1 hypothetical protein ASPVEDRAFT_762734 [Aspergillus versicolor CBS 583.65]